MDVFVKKTFLNLWQDNLVLERLKSNKLEDCYNEKR